MFKKQCLGTSLVNGTYVNNGPVNLDFGNGGVSARHSPATSTVMFFARFHVQFNSRVEWKSAHKKALAAPPGVSASVWATEIAYSYKLNFPCKMDACAEGALPMRSTP